jgi:hypothetical protein
LGYLVGRGSWWPNGEARRLGKHAIGTVMGSTYFFLTPLWELHPSLDPGRVPDALELAQEDMALKDTPEDLRSLLRDLQAQVHKATAVLERELPTHSARLRASAAELASSVALAYSVLQDAEAR